MRLVDRKPRGLLKALLRAPIWFYRAGFGRMLGHRLVYIAHCGRVSGLRREVVVEVVGYAPAAPEVVVIAAWGGAPEWYRNLKAGPALEVRLGAQRWERPDLRFLDSAQAHRVLCAYQREHPRAWKRIAPILRFPVDPADPQWSTVLDTVHAIAFTPRTP